MANYEIQLTISGETVKGMLKIEDAAKRMSGAVGNATKKISSDVEDLNKRFDKLKETIMEAFAVREIITFGRELMNVTAEFEGFENRVKFASTDLTDAGQNMNFLREETEKLHLPMRQVFEGFSEMQAGLKGTGVEGERLRTLFEGISVAAATLHLPTYQLQRTLYDLKEIGEIGLNARIMRSLNVALPGIGPLIKQTFGKGWKELEKEGIGGADFLNKLGPALMKNFQSGLDAYSNSLQAKMTDTQNKFLEAQLDLGEKLKPVFIEILGGINSVIGATSEFIGYLQEHGEQVKTLEGLVEGLVIAYGLYKGVLMTTTTLEKVGITVRQAYTFFTTEATAATEAFTASLGTTVLGAFAIAIGIIVQAMMNYNSQLDDAANKLTFLKELTGGINVTEQGFNDTRIEMAGIVSKSDEQRGRVYADIQKKRDAAQQFLDDKMIGSLGYAKSNVAEAKVGLAVDKNGNLLSANAQDQKDIESGKYLIATKAVDKLGKLQAEYERIHGIIGNYNADLNRIEDLGYKKTTYAESDPTATGAHSTHLAGAEGGLGQAKTINIKIDRVMTVENYDNKNLTKHAETAADYIIRTANNYSESQAGTQ